MWVADDVDIDGTNVAVRRCGPPGRTRPVVILHDAGAETVDAPAWELVGIDRPVVQVLLPGVGRSDPVPTGAGMTWVTDLLHGLLVRTAPEPATVVGSSLGGWFALETALAHADAVHDLLLLDSAGLQNPRDYLFSLFAAGQGQDGHDGLLGPLLAAHHTPSGPAAMTPYLADLTAAALSSWNAHSPDPSLLARCANLRTPTVILWGEQDGLIPRSHGHALARAIPGATMAVIDGAGHLLALDAPAEVARRLSVPVVPSDTHALG